MLLKRHSELNAIRPYLSIQPDRINGAAPNSGAGLMRLSKAYFDILMLQIEVQMPASIYMSQPIEQMGQQTRT
jgi:hypothetical protein